MGISLRCFHEKQNQPNKLVEKVDFMNFMNFQKFLLIGSLSLISLATLAQSDNLIEQAVNNSISAILPSGSQWQIKTPAFAKQNLKKWIIFRFYFLLASKAIEWWRRLK